MQAGISTSHPCELNELSSANTIIALKTILESTILWIIRTLECSGGEALIAKDEVEHLSTNIVASTVIFG